MITFYPLVCRKTQDLFVGHYVKMVTTSDGTIRRVELTPMVHKGMQVVQLKDNRGVHYTGLNGTTTDGTLMVQLRDVDDALASNGLSQRRFMVSIYEIRQNFAFGDLFIGHYVKTVTMSDGTIRRIELTPMVHKGMQVVEFRDNSGVSYMALSGTTTNGTLMVQVSDLDTMLAQAKAEGWPVPSSSAFRILPVLPVRVAFQRIRGAESEAMTITNEAEQPLNLFVAVFHSGKFVGTRQIPVPAHASSTVEASQAWKSPSRSSSRPGQGPQPGDQVRLIDIPNQAGSHAAIYQEWRAMVPY